MRWLLAIIVACVLFWALLLIFALSPNLAKSATLTCTAPTAGQYRWMAFDIASGDSVLEVECSGGPLLRDSMWITLWWQPISGGGFSPRESSWVAPGDSVNFSDPGPGNGYAIARNSVGQSCVTGTVYVPPGDPTDVPADPAVAEEVVRVHLFRATGQRVGIFEGWVWDKLWRAHGVMERSLLLQGISQGRLAAGVYFVRGVTRAGVLVPREGAKKVVLVR